MVDPDETTAPPCPLDDELSSFPERYEHVRGRLDALAKPVGSLGTLEDWCARICSLQRTPKPQIDDAICLIFAADHGAARSVEDGGEGCSAYPPSVTRKVVEALDRGMAGGECLRLCVSASSSALKRIIENLQRPRWRGGLGRGSGPSTWESRRAPRSTSGPATSSGQRVSGCRTGRATSAWATP